MKVFFIKKFIFVLNIATILFANLFFVAAFAQENTAPAVKKHKKEPPTRITSDVIDIKRKSQIMDFLGNVVVRKGTDTMIAEHMVLFYEDSNNSEMKSFNGPNSGPNGEVNSNKTAIKKIEAERNVKIFNAEMTALGDFGYYDPKEEIFVLEKNVVVNNGSSIGYGEKFVYNLKTQKGNFVGPKSTANNKNVDKRVVFVISDDDLKNGGKKKDNKNAKTKQENKEYHD